MRVSEVLVDVSRHVSLQSRVPAGRVSMTSSHAKTAAVLCWSTSVMGTSTAWTDRTSKTASKVGVPDVQRRERS